MHVTTISPLCINKLLFILIKNVNILILYAWRIAAMKTRSWEDICRNKEIPTNVFDCNLDNLDWFTISENSGLIRYPNKFIDKYSNKLDWDRISAHYEMKICLPHTLTS